MSKRILVWYRNDLRLNDHEPIHQALLQQSQVIPFYCFDQRQFTTTSFGFAKTGAFRTQFLLESITNLRNSLHQLGSNLVVRKGLPEIIIPALAKELGITLVYYHREVTSEEIAVEKALQKNLASIEVTMKGFWGATLYHPQQLPFKITQLPELFTNFRKAMEKTSPVINVLPTPQTLPPLPKLDVGKIPDITDLGLEAPNNDHRAVLQFKGGETQALARLEHYFWQANCLRNYKQTRNGLLGSDYSSKFSPWLANGCISPRFIYQQVKKYEQQRVKNDSTYWLVFELLWRDFFRFIAAKHGNHLFRASGLQGISIAWQEDWSRFKLWQEGQTGYPFVDANMRELAATGFMSNRGRQNVASFLTKNLGINWLMGAEWFESLLIDYDVCSNWGNWNYSAGVGNDARGFRYFNIPKQSQVYDSQGKYLKHWLPELASLPGTKIHQPWQLNQEEQKRWQVKLGVDYPRPIVDFFKSIKANEKVYQAGLSIKMNH